jgi:hypothetical protein
MSDKMPSQAKKGGAKIPRIPYEDFDPGLKEALRPKVERLGYCGEIWQIGANVPKSMLSFCNITEDLKDAISTKIWPTSSATAATGSPP